jgi:glucose/arabinose dehydrogenase
MGHLRLLKRAPKRVQHLEEERVDIERTRRWSVEAPPADPVALHNLAAKPQITVHLESGNQVVIVEGVAAASVLSAARADTLRGAHSTAKARQQPQYCESRVSGRAAIPLIVICQCAVARRIVAP